MADVTGYTLPGHEGTYMYADKFAREQIAAMADVVVEQGISGPWTYRKWASGIAECWINLGMDTPSNYTHDLPFEFLTGSLIATVKYHDGVGYNPPNPVNGWVAKTQIRLYTSASGVSSSNTYLVSVYVIGTWK